MVLKGRSTPIPIERKQDSLGIGRQALDIWWADSTTAKRKTLEAERQAEETEAEKSRREVDTIFFFLHSLIFSIRFEGQKMGQLMYPRRLTRLLVVGQTNKPKKKIAPSTTE
jgi:hypothetical protein